jgi:hypothetical protein
MTSVQFFFNVYQQHITHIQVFEHSHLQKLATHHKKNWNKIISKKYKIHSLRSRSRNKTFKKERKNSISISNRVGNFSGITKKHKGGKPT